MMMMMAMVCLMVLTIASQPAGQNLALGVAQHQQEVGVLVIDVLDALLPKAAVTLGFRFNVDGVQVAYFLVCHNE